MWRYPVIFVLLMVAIALGAPPKQATQRPSRSGGQQIQSTNSIAAVERAPKPSDYYDPCSRGKDNRSSDFCAQWKAADAAKEAADETLYLGIVGGLIGLVTLAIAWIAAGWAKKAAIHTEESAIEAGRSANAAERAADAAHDANRPWIEGEKPTNNDLTFTAAGIEFSAELGVVNHGNAPATNVLVRGMMVVRGASEPTQIIPISGIEEALDEWEVGHRDRGKIAYRGKPTTCIVVANLPASKIEEVEADEIRLCQYFIVVGVSYRFAGKMGRTVNAYLLQLPDSPSLLEPPYFVAENETRRVRDSQIKLTDILEGYAI